MPYLGDDPLEFGSGFGYFARGWLGAGVPRMTVSEVDAPSADRLRSTFADDPRVNVREIEITAPPQDLRRFSAVVALNVLEHIQDDVAALTAAGRLVRAADGAVVIFVPANPRAMSAFDRAIGHYRRYTERGLRETFEAAGLLVETARYVNAPGLVAWLVGVKLLKRSPADTSAVLVYDKLAIPASRWLDERIRMPFGQSLFAVRQPLRLTVTAVQILALCVGTAALVAAAALFCESSWNPLTYRVCARNASDRLGARRRDELGAFAGRRSGPA